MKNACNTILFLAIWVTTGVLLYLGLQLATPALDGWLDLLLYGRVTEPGGAARFILFLWGFTAVHLAPIVAPLIAGPVIINLMQRHPVLCITLR